MLEIFEITFSFVISLFLYRKVIPFLKKNLLDVPNDRSAHKLSKPKSGGIIFFLVTIASNLIKNDYSILSIMPISLVGLIDDKVNLSYKYRLFFQFLNCLLLLIFSLNIESISFTSNNLIILSFFLFVGVGIINFCNFMDGIDGLLAGTMLVIFTSILISTDFNNYTLIGSLIAFLIFNWSPSKLFMGDIGSYFLGALYVNQIYIANSFEASFAILLFSFPLIADCFFTLLRRLFLKQNIFSAHNLHLYQRLSKGKYGHSSISTLYIIFTTLIVLSYFIGGIKYEIIACLFTLYIGFLADKYFAKNFS